jgi:hypothetical protein
MTVEIKPGDPRYVGLCSGMNQRWVAAPDRICLVTSTADVVAAVQSAVARGQRIGIRSGGNCYRNFVCHPDVGVIIDMSEFSDVSYDERRQAFSVAAGARLIDVYERLHRRWNVTIPGGHCPTVGAGGHVTGGGFGLLSRRHGLTVDHLYAVEVVVVDDSGAARSVIATREPGDPNRDLWWAHTGGGGGNFGVVTRFWFRSADAGLVPAEALLPRPPSELLVSTVFLPWSELSERSFGRLMTNYGQWYIAHRDGSDRERALAGYLVLSSRVAGSVALLTTVDASVPRCEELLAGYEAFITSGVRATPVVSTRRLPWLKATQSLAVASPALNDPTLRGEYKSAYFRGGFQDEHVAACYKHLARTDHGNRNAMVLLLPYGGKVGEVAAGETASPHRQAALKMLVQSLWTGQPEDTMHVQWARDIYSEMFAATGGVPVPNDVTDGCFINYPDTDLGLAEYNRSGCPWHELYYKDVYPRLQQAKTRWDPMDVFRHEQSVQRLENRGAEPRAGGTGVSPGA